MLAENPRFTLLTGGARSGKSSTAARLAAASTAPVSIIATATAEDTEMEARIARHQADRNAAWTTIEEPLALDQAIIAVDVDHTLIIDCLALWVTNQITSDDDEVLARADGVARLLEQRPGTTIVVTNEVGAGIVPVNAMARRFRDLLGSVNQRFAQGADRTLLCVAGGVVPVVEVEAL